MFGKPASTLPCAAQIFDAVGQGVKRGVAVIGVGVEGEADVCAEVVQSAGKDLAVQPCRGVVWSGRLFLLHVRLRRGGCRFLAAKCRAANRVRGGLATR